jgi:hypothetical protein
MMSVVKTDGLVILGLEPELERSREGHGQARPAAQP